MNCRPALVIFGVLLVSVLASCQRAATPPDAARVPSRDSAAETNALPLGVGRHLFIDDANLAEGSGFTRQLGRPARDDTPMVDGKESPDHCSQPYVTVIHDEAEGLFRLWYNTRVKPRETQISLLTSTDGRNWQRPHRVVMSFQGYCCAIIETPPHHRTEANRFRLAYWANFEDRPYNRSDRIGISTAISADGVHWVDDPDNPMISDRWDHSPENDPKHIGHPDWKHAPADIVDLVFDPVRSRYVITNKTWTQPPTEFGPVSRSYPYGRRLVSQTVSSNFEEWTRLRRVFVPDDQDEGEFEFYGCKVIVRGRQLIGFVRILRDDVGDGIGYTVLATSTDGENWTRMREPFLDRHAEAGRWDSAVSWVGECITVGDEEFLYFGAYAGGHKKFDDRTLGFASLRRDGFVGLESTASTARLSTVQLELKNRRLLLNAAVRGALRARLVDESGTVVPGYDFAEFNGGSQLSGDSVRHELTWTAEPSDRPASAALELEWSDGTVYALEVTPK